MVPSILVCQLALFPRFLFETNKRAKSIESREIVARATLTKTITRLRKCHQRFKLKLQPNKPKTSPKLLRFILTMAMGTARRTHEKHEQRKPRRNVPLPSMSKQLMMIHFSPLWLLSYTHNFLLLHSKNEYCLKLQVFKPSSSP
jgi:hypothetical protein